MGNLFYYPLCCAHPSNSKNKEDVVPLLDDQLDTQFDAQLDIQFDAQFDTQFDTQLDTQLECNQINIHPSWDKSATYIYLINNNAMSISKNNILILNECGREQNIKVEISANDANAIIINNSNGVTTVSVSYRMFENPSCLDCANHVKCKKCYDTQQFYMRQMLSPMVSIDTKNINISVKFTLPSFLCPKWVNGLNTMHRNELKEHFCFVATVPCISSYSNKKDDWAFVDMSNAKMIIIDGSSDGDSSDGSSDSSSDAGVYVEMTMPRTCSVALLNKYYHPDNFDRTKNCHPCCGKKNVGCKQLVF